MTGAPRIPEEAVEAAAKALVHGGSEHEWEYWKEDAGKALAAAFHALGMTEELADRPFDSWTKPWRRSRRLVGAWVSVGRGSDNEKETSK